MVPTSQKGKSKQEKLVATWLYVYGFSFRTIAKFLKFSTHSVFVWVRAFAEKNYAKPEPASAEVIIELDEMLHFLGLKKNKFGSGKLTVEQLSSLLTGSVAQEITRLLQKCTIGWSNEM